MAEAALEDRQLQKFFCHICNIRFENASDDYTCPQCSGGFIEELEVPIVQQNQPSTEAIEILDDDDDENYNTTIIELNPFLAGGGPTDFRRPSRQQRQDTRRRRYASVHPRRGVARPRSLPRTAAPTGPRQLSPFENIIQEVILNLGVGVDWTGSANMQLFLGNPADYAWGREGLDAIVTQLLNQMDGTGPPPLAKDIIDAIPMVEVTEEQVDTKLQCSICWEDFILKENVRQLSCLHIYHENCIRPWLQLHATCPICRQTLGTGENPINEHVPLANNVAGPTMDPYEQLEQLFWSTTHRSNSPSSSTATRGSGSSSSSNSSSSNRDYYRM